MLKNNLEKVKYVALTTCHNRREKTLSSVAALAALSDVKVIVVDDGSDDGTADALHHRFGSTVDVLHGDGTLFWSQGMNFGYEYVKKTYDFEDLLVFNDDVRFFDGFIKKFEDARREHVSQAPCVIVGTCIDGFGKITYSGVHEGKFWGLQFIRNRSLSSVEVDTLNMNAVLIPKEILIEVGFLKKYFVHGGADYEFGLRVSKRFGYKIFTSKGAVGNCERNPPKKFCFSGSLKDLVKEVNHRKNYPFAPRLRFYLSYYPFSGAFFALWPYFKIAAQWLNHRFKDRQL